MMITIMRGTYVLLLSYNPCDIFDYYNVNEMHGLNKADCAAHVNSTESAYIAGWTNYVPKASGEYDDDDPRFIFINLSRCTDTAHTVGLIMHEMMHQSFYLHKDEEEIITWAEEETYQVYDIIKPFLTKAMKRKLTYEGKDM
jgi:predicted aminopeptidase